MDDATRQCLKNITTRLHNYERDLNNLAVAVAHNHTIAVKQTICIHALRDALMNVPSALQILNHHLEN